jgi:anhydro-N-acetylmuramic acid kinase
MAAAATTGSDAADGHELFVGLISGTSVDGIDAALVRFAPSPQLVFGRTYPMPAALVDEVLRVSQADDGTTLDALGRLDTRLGTVFADAALSLLRDAGVPRDAVRAIGSHGQTLRHDPRGDAPFTMQLGDASVIVERTGITTVADFRSRDVAAGGQGAPLLPVLHAALLRRADEARAVLNLGGIANLTLLPATGPVRGFDTGPANGLMDAWCLRERGQRFDRDGAFAAEGQVDTDLLARLLGDEWLRLPPPKSTGRDHFHLPWLAARLGDAAARPADVQATLQAFTARTVADQLRQQLPDCHRLLVCGGGVHNPGLMSRLRDELTATVVESTANHGVDPDFVEAMAFAWLARETLAGRPGTLPEVTGARGPRILGAIHPA